MYSAAFFETRVASDDSKMFDAATTIISILIASAGVLFAWRTMHEADLRRGDVLAWANEVVAALESLFLITSTRADAIASAELDRRLDSVIFETAILVERGRLFFKNKADGTFGKENLPAYQGYRPRILDAVVVAHQVAMAWRDSPEEERHTLHKIAEACLKKFVSLARFEVGRSRTASAHTAIEGDGTHLRHLLAANPTALRSALSNLDWHLPIK